MCDTPSIEFVIFQLFDQLNPPDQIDRVMLLIGMPDEHYPFQATNHFKANAIVRWARGNAGCGLDRLAKVLKSRINPTTTGLDINAGLENIDSISQVIAERTFESLTYVDLKSLGKRVIIRAKLAVEIRDL